MSNGVDIVLVKPGSQKQLYGELSAFEMTAIEPPMWAALLAAYLREKEYSVVLFDAEVEGWSYEETAARIREAQPLLAVVSVSGTNPSASTMNMTGAGQILRHLKETDPGIKGLLMGLHPSALPERTMREEKVDFVCQGEGFCTLPALLDALKSSEKSQDIPGLWYRQGGQILSNSRPPDWDNLDELPRPAWDLLPMTNYRAHNWHCFDAIEQRQPYGVIYTSLGCPFRCSFCCINALFGRNTIRYRSPDKVIEEIDWLVNSHGVRNIKILDEMFALKEDHVLRFCDLVIDRGYDLNMWAYARVNTVSQTMLSRMKRAGVNWVAYGFESGNKQVLKDVTKGYDPEHVLDVVKMTYSEGIHVCSNFIFGLPKDDYDCMQQTLNLATEINAEWANLYSAMAYPGSKLYEEAVEQALPLPETWQGYSQYAYECLPLPTHKLSSGEVLAFRDYAFDAYYTNPRYLDRIDRCFGRETVQHIRKMSEHKLPRKHTQFGGGNGHH